VTTGGAKDRSCVAYDSVNHRWLVQFNNGANAGFSYDQYGQFVDPDGTLRGSQFPIAHTPAFEGDTQFGGDVAFVPIAQRYFSSFGTDTGMGGQESFVNGSPVGMQVVLGAGYFTSLNNAADPQRNRFLTTWEGLVGGSWYVLAQLCAASIKPVTNFAAGGQNSQNVLSWRNPSDAHFTGTMIRAKTSGYPAGPEDGELVVDKAMTPGGNDSFLHSNLANWTTYYYAAFAHDVGPNYSVVAQAAATPRPGLVTIGSSDFNSGPDGWTLQTWRAGTLGYGTVAWDAAGNIVSTGSGLSNNRDTCTREGSIMTQLISTAGRQSIQVEYDVMAALTAPSSGSLSGSCSVLDNSEEDKLVVFYSISGTNGPWNIAQVLNEGVELPTAWTRKLINLAGVSAVNNNPNFALRFQWQFNASNDTGAVDNISVLSGAVTGPLPAITLSPTKLERTIQAGQNGPGDVLRVGNSGAGALFFNVSANVPWLYFNPANGSSAGPERRVLAICNTAGLTVGDYDALIQVASAQAVNSPQSIPVTVHIIPPSCFWEPFDFYDGNLTLMGAAKWSGTASNELQVQNRVLKIFGGSGAVSASHMVNCTGSNGLIGAQIKIQKGVGTGDFFWNIAFDDPAGNNLARWYGGSTIARGRVGGSITADIPFSGPGVWDDLYLKLDTEAKTSEFFFNGVSFGAIPHGNTASNVIGSIRIERLDRASAMNDEISFDSLGIGALDATPPRLTATRVGNAVVVSWAADRMGAALECISDFTPVDHWTTITNGITITNGRNTFTVVATNASSFYRLRLRGP
jgi:hypothetical protein